MPTTPNRGYDLIPTGVAPDVPYWFNRLLAMLDADVDAVQDGWTADPAFTTKANAKISELLAAGGTLTDAGTATTAATTTGTADDLVGTKWWSVWSVSQAQSLKLPLAEAGGVLCFKYGSTATYFQVQFGYQRMAIRSSLSGGWRTWRILGEAYKTVPVALTAGDGGGTDTATSRTVRYPIKLARRVPRWRVHLRNINPLQGTAYTGALSFSGLGIAPATAVTAPDGKLGTMTTIDGAFTTSNAGAEYVSPWQETPLEAHTDYILTGGYTCAAQSNFSGVSGGWVTASAADWNVPAPAGLTLTASVPLDVWIECEVPASTPHYAYLGDSLTAGNSARLPVYDSWANRHALANNVLPSLYAHSGASMGSRWDSAASYVYKRFDTLSGTASRADRLYWSMGSNDLSGKNVAAMRTAFNAAHANLAALVSRNIYLTTILPRHDGAAVFETNRKAWNEVLRTELPGDALACYDPAAALTDPSGSVLDKRWTASPTDIHLTAAGYARFASSLDAQGNDSRAYTVDETAGRVVRIWDYLNNREQMIWSDTGLRDISTLVPNWTSGAVYLHRVGNVVTLYSDSMITADSGTFTNAAMIPFGFRPASTATGLSMHLVPGLDQYRLSVSGAGNFSCYNYVTGKYIRMMLTWTTNNTWPTSLPGTAVGGTPA